MVNRLVLAAVELFEVHQGEMNIVHTAESVMYLYSTHNLSNPPPPTPILSILYTGTLLTPRKALGVRGRLFEAGGVGEAYCFNSISGGVLPICH